MCHELNGSNDLDLYELPFQNMMNMLPQIHTTRWVECCDCFLCLHLCISIVLFKFWVGIDATACGKTVAASQLTSSFWIVHRSMLFLLYFKQHAIRVQNAQLLPKPQHSHNGHTGDAKANGEPQTTTPHHHHHLARSKFSSQNVQNTAASDQFL